MIGCWRNRGQSTTSSFLNDNRSNLGSVDVRREEIEGEILSVATEASKCKSCISSYTSNIFFQKPSSCLDHLRNGALQSGVYEINDHDDVRYQVYCDLSSELGMAWTLVISQAFSNRNLEYFKNPLSMNYPINHKSPRWDAYRLSLLQMNKLKFGSSHWRITCNFNTDGLIYRDYVRARFDDFDAINFESHGKGQCRKVEYMNVRGHNCTGCTSYWWQTKDPVKRNFLHHDSSYNKCEFGETTGAVSSEDNFGWYDSKYKANKKFRCTSALIATTNHWFGGYV